MKKALVLCFYVDCEDYDLNTLKCLSDDALYGLAKDGIEKGTTDIYTLAEFCLDINCDKDRLSNYYTFQIYVEEKEYEQWSK